MPRNDAARGFLAAIVFAIVVGGCSTKESGHTGAGEEAATPHGATHHETPGEHAEGVKEVHLSPAALVEFGIEIRVAGSGRVTKAVHLPGEVRANGDRLAHIVPRFEGVVTEVHGAIGESVRKGAVLAVIESNESLAPYELKTQIDGVIIQKHVTQGEVVERDHEAFVIADLGTVWVDLSVYQRDLSRVKVGRAVHIVSGEEGPEARGSISYLTPVVDEATRTATARIVLPNPDGAWRPGMFVIGRVMTDDVEVPLAVPRSALQTIENVSVVFVATGDGFVPRPVVLGQMGEEDVEVVSGLQVGERYVSRGGFTLKAELAKGSLESGHSH